MGFEGGKREEAIGKAIIEGRRHSNQSNHFGFLLNAIEKKMFWRICGGRVYAIGYSLFGMDRGKDKGEETRVARLERGKEERCRLYELKV